MAMHGVQGLKTWGLHKLLDKDLKPLPLLQLSQKLSVPALYEGSNMDSGGSEKDWKDFCAWIRCEDYCGGYTSALAYAYALWFWGWCGTGKLTT